MGSAEKLKSNSQHYITSKATQKNERKMQWKPKSDRNGTGTVSVLTEQGPKRLKTYSSQDRLSSIRWTKILITHAQEKIGC